MSHISTRRKLSLRILVSLIASVILVFLYRRQSVHLDWLFQGPLVTPQPAENIHLSRVGFLSGNSSTVNRTSVSAIPNLLGVASSITIISLPDRLDRRQDMEALRLSLGIPHSEWRYTDAIGSADQRVRLVMRWVQSVRSTFSNSNGEGTPKFALSELDEKEVERLVKSEGYLNMWDMAHWPSPFASGFTTGLNSSNELPLIGSATKDDKFPTSSEAKHFPNHKLLTSARVACWYSHLEVIHKIANTPIDTGKTYLILEDDVDMEADVQEQIGVLWGHLRKGWDIVFLGHCWSNESYYPPLTPKHPSLLHALHPSRRPKCTHAYALSRTGARRFLLHLRYPPFAFSRAIDQAFAWLIESGRVKGAYSIVPSLVVQRKVRASDVFGGSGGKGSRWKEKLRNGILDGSKVV